VNTRRAATVSAPSTSVVSAYGDDALGDFDCVALADRIRRGETTSGEVVEAAVARSRGVNPDLNAIVCETYDAAIARARSGVSGRFGGLPTFIKDTDAVEGTPLGFGASAFPKTPNRKSSGYVRQMLATGLVSLGKTTLPELGLTATTESLATGPTRNPWNTGHSTGGSSGGSAAMVAAGVVPIAHANDGGGSIRIPASCCGLVGLKPSRGRLVPADGAKFFPIDIISQGVVTRSVRDTAAFLAAAEAVQGSRRLRPVGLVEGPGSAKYRIACFTDSPDGVESHPDCTSATERTAKALEAMGHEVDRIRCPFDGQVTDDFIIYWGFAPWSIGLFGKRVFGRDYDHSQLDQWSLALSDLFRRNLRRMPGILWRLRRFARQYETVFQRYDVLLSPTLAQPPVPLGYISPDIPYDTALERLMGYASFTPVQNLSGGAAISLPLALGTNGLPIGVHLAGNIGAERRLLELSFALEEAMPWPLLADVAGA
jgi:amidase